MTEQNLTRRALLAAGGSAALLSGLSTAMTDDGGNQETLRGGQMALSQSYNVAGSLWIGPESARTNVDADSGRIYVASDTQVEYYGDGSSWTKMGVGSDQEPVPSVSTEDATTTRMLDISREDYNPYPTRTFEEGGAYSLKPHEGVDNPIIPQAADPFIVEDSGTLYCFYETFPNNNIGYRTSDDGGVTWSSETTAIDGNFYAYPLLWKWNGTWYMTPTRDGSSDVWEVWTADSFPDSWSLAETPLTGQDYIDPTPVYWNDRWYVFFFDNANSNVILYYADSEGGPITGQSWTEHPSSPIVDVSTDDRSRLGGRAVSRPSYIDLPYQADVQQTGSSTALQGVRMYRVTELSPTAFTETELGTSPVLARTNAVGDWREGNMHHADVMMDGPLGQPIVAVDGKPPGGDWNIGLYTVSEQSPTAFTAHLSSDQSFASSTAFDVVSFDTQEGDVGGNFHDNASIYDVPSSGYYQFEAAVTFKLSATSATDVPAGILIDDGDNGDLAVKETEMNVNKDHTLYVQTPRVYLPAGHRIWVEVYQDSGTSVDADSTNVKTYFSGQKIW